MAVVETKATAISNRDASPRIISDALIVKGDMQEACGAVESVSGDDIASKYYFASVPSNARVSEVLLGCDGGNTTGAMDIGLYRSTIDGGVVVDADFFASAQVLTAALVNSDVTHESAVYDLGDSEKQLWEALGLTEDPRVTYDVIGTLTAASDAADSVVLKVRFVM